MKIDPKIIDALQVIADKTNPVSVFVYGSRAREDFREDSDYEIGMLFTEARKWSRTDLTNLHRVSGLNIYPFSYEQFCKYELDTPFPKAIYLRDLFDGGAHTLIGEEIVEQMKPPAITMSDLLEEISFDIARAYSALLSMRQKDFITASAQFVKSVMFGTKTYIALSDGIFASTYMNIVASVGSLGLKPEYKDLIQIAMQIREKTLEIQTSYIFTNISYLSQVVRSEIKNELRKGDRIVLDGVIDK